ncbi:hypothetical protein [Paraburkholderia domus]|uniref:hypothetical protein n=1 Tax=Paraburkholderia domus TaxID=2793075 RepID=UPI0019125AD3|nr:hypothetical protein [Paraburkholderia domus]MBK5165072.1 hypothetical protein [Burkholderia sp. R-70211]
MTEEANNGAAATLGSLDDLIQRGARQIIQQTSEVELATLLELREREDTWRETPGGTQRLSARARGLHDYRESKNSWHEMSLDLK